LNREQKLAIVTGGAGGGIGHGISSTLARDGWAVLIVERDENAADQLQKQLQSEGCSIETIILDLTDNQASKRIVEKANTWCGRIDGLINNAGIGGAGIAIETEDDDFDKLMAVNLKAVFRLSRDSFPLLKQTKGVIVNLGSVHGRSTTAAKSIYAASKAGIEGMTRGLACEFSPEGVRVNCIWPGLVDGPQTRQDIAASVTDEVERWIEQFTWTKQLLPWTAMPEDIGKLVKFLLAPDSRCITGQSIVIDQGTLALLWDREK